MHSLPQTYLGELTGGTGTAYAYGVVLHQKALVYLDMAGAKTAVEAIWARLVQGHAVNLVDLQQNEEQGIALAPMSAGAFARYQKQIITGLEHCVLLDQRMSQPAYAQIGTTFLFHFDRAQAVAKLAEHITNLVMIPVFPAWHEFLWERGTREGLIQPCQSVGNTLQFYWLNLDQVEWHGVIQRGLRDCLLTFPK